jgi:uncharacterized protein YaaN involved in tellurite resistance
MPEETRAGAVAAAKLVEKVNAVVLLEPKTEIVPLEKADNTQAAQIRAKMAEVDITDTNSIVSFGSQAQAGLQQISQTMLDGVRNKDVGPAGDALSNMVTSIRGFEISELDTRRSRSWWERLLGRAAPFAKFLSRYETVQLQIDKITG